MELLEPGVEEVVELPLEFLDMVGGGGAPASTL
jgi:hypothetical protein